MGFKKIFTSTTNNWTNYSKLMSAELYLYDSGNFTAEIEFSIKHYMQLLKDEEIVFNTEQIFNPQLTWSDLNGSSHIPRIKSIIGENKPKM